MRTHGAHSWSFRASTRGVAAFTLPEILIAVVIGATLVTAAVTFALSMGELWGNGSEVRLFDQHVRGVSRFLETILRQAQPPPPVSEGGLPQAGAQGEPAAPGTSAAQQRQNQAATDPDSVAPVVWQAPRGREFGSDELLTFELLQSPGVFAWPEQPLPFVVCALRVDRRGGLSLLWKSRLEIDFDDTSPREMRVSPFVTQISYFYYDTDGPRPSWQERDQPLVGDNQVKEVPQRIRLTFEYQGETRTVDVPLPGTPLGVPVY